MDSWFLGWFILLCLNVKLNVIEGQRCPERNWLKVYFAGRFCGKACTLGDFTCDGPSLCSCDDICGYSCVPTKGVKCYVGVKDDSNGNVLMNSVKEERCQVDEVCMYFISTASVSALSLSAHVYYGQCLQASSCLSFICSSALLQPHLRNSLAIEIDECRFECCASDLCNQPIASPTSTSHVSLPHLSFKGQVTCYTGIKITTTDGNIRGNQAEKLCDWGEICYVMTTPVSIYKNGISQTGFVSVGQCIASYICSLLTCKSMQHLLPNNIEIDFKKCSATCCQKTLCNVPVKATSTASIETPTAFKEQCGYNVTVDASYLPIEFPYNNLNYSGNLNCYWELSIKKPGYKIKIDFEKFKIQQCCDYLSISENGTKVKEYKQKKNSNFSFVSQTGIIMLHFHSDDVTGEVGFKATLTAVPPYHPQTRNQSAGLCGGNFTANTSTQILSFPTGAIGSYPNNVNCKWIISANTPGYRVELRFNSFSTERCCDYLEISNNRSFLRQMGGHVHNAPVYVSGEKSISLKFHSDSSVNSSGFSLLYFETNERSSYSTKFVVPKPVDIFTADRKKTCGSNVTVNAHSHVLKFPSGSGNYENDLDCFWYISASKPGNRIRIRFEMFDTQKCCDYLAISENGREVRSLAGNYRHDLDFHSKTSNVVLWFHSNAAVTGRGFRATFSG